MELTSFLLPNLYPTLPIPNPISVRSSLSSALLLLQFLLLKHNQHYSIGKFQKLIQVSRNKKNFLHLLLLLPQVTSRIASSDTGNIQTSSGIASYHFKPLQVSRNITFKGFLLKEAATNIRSSNRGGGLM